MVSLNKSQKTLISFLSYCLQHPTERFWQALKNWSGYGFIYGQREGEFLVEAKDHKGNKIKVEDTYNET